MHRILSIRSKFHYFYVAENLLKTMSSRPDFEHVCNESATEKFEACRRSARSTCTVCRHAAEIMKPVDVDFFAFSHQYDCDAITPVSCVSVLVPIVCSLSHLFNHIRTLNLFPIHMSYFQAASTEHRVVSYYHTRHRHDH